MILIRLILIAITASSLVGLLVYLGAVSYRNFKKLLKCSSNILKEANSIEIDSIDKNGDTQNGNK
jgi:hypothetical protein